MTKLIGREATPNQLIDELNKMNFGEGALVVMKVSQWKQIVDAYHSPMVKRIADNIIQVVPIRSVPDGKLSFRIFQRVR